MSPHDCASPILLDFLGCGVNRVVLYGEEDPLIVGGRKGLRIVGATWVSLLGHLMLAGLFICSKEKWNASG